jgi:hypothetical protein
MRPNDLSLTVSQRKLACVLDPALVLAYAQGPGLALRLTQVLEPWLTRSFWQTIDASELLLGHASRQCPTEIVLPRLLPDVSALSAWIALRDSTDAGSWPLRWIGDNVAQSQVGDNFEADVVDRYEHLACALADRASGNVAEIGCWAEGMDPVLGAMDTLALSATLGGALVLSMIPSASDSIPWPVQAMTLAGLKSLRLDPVPIDSLFASERQWVRDALVSAGLAAVAERLPRLVVVHIMVDANVPQSPGQESADSVPLDPWAAAQGWWYLL